MTEALMVMRCPQHGNLTQRPTAKQTTETKELTLLEQEWGVEMTPEEVEDAREWDENVRLGNIDEQGRPIRLPRNPTVWMGE